MFKKSIKSHGKPTGTVVYAASISNQLIISCHLHPTTHVDSKKHAFPSGPPVHSDLPTLTAHDEELNRRIYKRPCPANESATLPPEKRPRCASSDDRDELHTKLQQKIRTLQQKLRRTKKKMNTMHEVIQFLEEKLVLNPKESEALQSTLNNIQLKFLYNFKDNIKSTPISKKIQ